MDDLVRRRPAVQANQHGLLDFIEREQLHGVGCGMLDLALLTSALLSPRTQLWTLDKRLATLASRFGVAYVMPG